jgi:hypothetical protein
MVESKYKYVFSDGDTLETTISNIESGIVIEALSSIGKEIIYRAKGTGLKDSRDIDIYSGDKLAIFDGEFNVLGVVTYWKDEARFVLADENGQMNDWTLEDEAQPINWHNLRIIEE